MLKPNSDTGEVFDEKMFEKEIAETFVRAPVRRGGVRGALKGPSKIVNEEIDVGGFLLMIHKSRHKRRASTVSEMISEKIKLSSSRRKRQQIFYVS